MIDRVYTENSFFQVCPRIPKYLKGHLNSTMILEKANLSNLVEFYSDKINSTKGKYVNKNIDKNKNIGYWTLWNSKNMSLLNVTNSYFGEDGHRIQPGKIHK